MYTYSVIFLGEVENIFQYLSLSFIVVFVVFHKFFFREIIIID